MRTPTLQDLADRAAISDVVHAYAAELDARDWAMLEGCLTDPVHIDYTTYDPSLDLEMPAAEWARRVREGLSGFDATHHMSANHRHELRGDEARCVSYMSAAHFLREGERQDVCFLYGYYTNDLKRTASGWRIAKCALTITASHGDSTVFARAVERFSRRRLP